MPQEKLKIFILTHGGSERLLEILSENDLIEVTGVFVEKARQPNRSFKKKLERSIKYDGYLETVKKLSAKFLGGKTEGAEELAQVQSSQKSLNKTAEKLGISLFHVDNYHSKEMKETLQDLNADLGVLYGTNIIRRSVFQIPRLGSINIHQGLAPFYRGGPPIFWELFNGEKEVGLTVHFVAAKVDTGDLILQKTVPLEYDFDRYGLNYEDFLSDFKSTLVEPSSQMVADAIDRIARGTEKRKKQDTTLGKRYRLPTKREKDEIIKILKKRQNS